MIIVLWPSGIYCEITYVKHKTNLYFYDKPAAAPECAQTFCHSHSLTSYFHSVPSTSLALDQTFDSLLACLSWRSAGKPEVVARAMTSPPSGLIGAAHVPLIQHQMWSGLGLSSLLICFLQPFFTRCQPYHPMSCLLPTSKDEKKEKKLNGSNTVMLWWLGRDDLYFRLPQSRALECGCGWWMDGGCLQTRWRDHVNWTPVL